MHGRRSSTRKSRVYIVTTKHVWLLSRVYIVIPMWLEGVPSNTAMQRILFWQVEVSTTGILLHQQMRTVKEKEKEVIDAEDSTDKSAQILSDPKATLLPEAVVAPVQGPAGNSDAVIVENFADNRFSALADNVVDDNVVDSIEAVQAINEVQVEGVAGNENENEIPVAVVVNDSSSEDSEFVDATQVDHNEV
ncbi:phospholipase D [Trifolium repens]|nr:phospholipase D [Trifolium repens]